MSPLWRDEVTIELAPRRLALVRRARGIRPRVVAATEVPVPDGALGDPAPVLARLAELLRDPAWHRARVRVIVADHPWVRYAVAPWPGTRLDEAGRITHARYVLADAFGGSVADWDVALSDTPPGRPYVACAMLPALRGMVEAAAREARSLLVSLRPRLVEAFHAWRRLLPASDAWFVSVGDGALAAVRLRKGTWERVHVARLPSDWEVELQRLQAFDRATRPAGVASRILVDAPARMRGAARAAPGVEWLEGTSP